jgi:hypothetical protein
VTETELDEVAEYLAGERAARNALDVLDSICGGGDLLFHAVADLLKLEPDRERALRAFLRVLEKRLTRG